MSYEVTFRSLRRNGLRRRERDFHMSVIVLTTDQLGDNQRENGWFIHHRLDSNGASSPV